MYPVICILHSVRRRSQIRQPAQQNLSARQSPDGSSRMADGQRHSGRSHI